MKIVSQNIPVIKLWISWRAYTTFYIIVSP